MLFDEDLSPEQVELLTLIWDCIPLAVQARRDPEWPVWDYVRRSLYREFPHLDSAESVLLSLPSWPRPWADSQTRPYGLVWHTGDVRESPARESRIGLTVAGLALLARHGRPTLGLADGLAHIIGEAARFDEKLQSQPSEVVKAEFPLHIYLDEFERPTRERPFVFPANLVSDAFDRNREYPRLQLSKDGSGRPVIDLGWMGLREYRAVSTAGAYLARVEDDQSAHAARVRYSSPLTLIQTLDYLGYVLADDPRFGWPRLTVAPSLQSAAALSAYVADRAQYDSALSGLWNVIGQLDVPPLPTEVVATRFADQPPQSLGRFRYWLDQCLGDEVAAQRGNEAIAIVQKVGRLRVEPQHTSTRATREAIEIRRELGLPDYVSDYQTAWDQIRDCVAGAFNVVREVIQQTA